MSTTKEKSRIRQLHVGRVYNLGNYENMRVEVVVDIATDDSPTKVFRNLERILTDLNAKSSITRFNYERAKEILSKKKKDMSADEKATLDVYKDRVNKYEEAAKRRQAARAALETLNYTQEHRDAKDSWDDEDY